MAGGGGGEMSSCPSSMAVANCAEPGCTAYSVSVSGGGGGVTSAAAEINYCKKCEEGYVQKVISGKCTSSGTCNFWYATCVQERIECKPACGTLSWGADPSSTGRQRQPIQTCDYTSGKCVTTSYNYRCAANYFADSGSGSSLVCTACPANSTSSVGSSGSTACKCNANYYKDGDSCIRCPDGGTSPAGSTSVNQCSCPANTYKADSACVDCPSNSTSSAGSDSIEDCKCNANYYKAERTSSSCSPCPEGGYSPSSSIGINSCYVGSPMTGNDVTGKFSYKANCYHQ